MSDNLARMRESAERWLAGYDPEDGHGLIGTEAGNPCLQVSQPVVIAAFEAGALQVVKKVEQAAALISDAADLFHLYAGHHAERAQSAADPEAELASLQKARTNLEMCVRLREWLVAGSDAPVLNDTVDRLRRLVAERIDRNPVSALQDFVTPACAHGQVLDFPGVASRAQARRMVGDRPERVGNVRPQAAHAGPLNGRPALRSSRGGDGQRFPLSTPQGAFRTMELMQETTQPADDLSGAIRLAILAGLGADECSVDIGNRVMTLLMERGHYLPGRPPAALILEDAQSFAERLTLSNLALRVMNMLAWSTLQTPETTPARRWLDDYLEGKNHGPVGQPMLWPAQLPGMAQMLRDWGFAPTPTQPAYVARDLAPIRPS